MRDILWWCYRFAHNCIHRYTPTTGRPHNMHFLRLVTLLTVPSGDDVHHLLMTDLVK